MKVTNKPGIGVFAAFLIFYGYVSFLVSIVSHVTSWQNRIILHSTFHCFLIHGCLCFCRSHLTRDMFCYAAWYSFIVRLFFCYLVHCKWPYTRYIFWWTFCDPLTIFDSYTHVYAKRHCHLWDTLLHKIQHVWAKWSWGQPYQSLTFLQFAFCRLLLNVSVIHYPGFFVKIINLITIYSIFFNSLETKSGRVNFEERLCPPTFIQSASSHQ